LFGRFLTITLHNLYRYASFEYRMVLHFVLSSVLCFWLVSSLNIVFTVFLNFNFYLIFLYVLTIAQTVLS